jgi:hypothetical protein
MLGGLRLVTPPNSDKYAQESSRQFDEAYGESLGLTNMHAEERKGEEYRGNGGGRRGGKEKSKTNTENILVFIYLDLYLIASHPEYSKSFLISQVFHSPSN